MKKVLIFALAAIAFLGCNKAENPIEVSSHKTYEPFVLQAYADEIGTKAKIDGSLNIKWADGDEIIVGMYETDGEYTPWEATFNLTKGSGTTNGILKLLKEHLALAHSLMQFIQNIIILLLTQATQR